MKKITQVIYFLLSTVFSLQAFSKDNKGVIDVPREIAIISYDTDNGSNGVEDSGAFLLVEDAPAGTQIRCIDKTWNRTVFVTGEEALLWENNTGKTIPAGTAIYLYHLNGPGASASQGTITAATANHDGIVIPTGKGGLGSHIPALSNTRRHASTSPYSLSIADRLTQAYYLKSRKPFGENTPSKTLAATTPQNTSSLKTTRYHAEDTTAPIAPPAIIEIGGGTTISTSTDLDKSPWNTFFEDTREQFLITASELTALGLSNGDNLYSLAFNLVEDVTPASNVTISIKSTTSTNLTNSDFEETGFTQVYSGSHDPSTGWDQIVFDTPYAYDGNGILINFCIDNSEIYVTSKVVYTTTSGYNSHRFAYNDNTNGCILNSIGSNAHRANMQFSTIPIDNTPPSFENGTPNASNITETGFTLNTDINEVGTIFYVVVPNGATPPTSNEVVNGQGNGGSTPITADNASVNSGGYTHPFTVTGLAPETVYDVYVVARDDYGTPNLQASPTAINDVTTVDMTPPIFNSAGSTPNDNAAGVSISDNLIIDFNETIVAGVGNITLKIAGGLTVEQFDAATATATTSPGPGAIGIVDDKVYLNPTNDLMVDTAYAIQIAANAIEDIHGNSFPGITNDMDFNFSTDTAATSTATAFDTTNGTHLSPSFAFDDDDETLTVAIASHLAGSTLMGAAGNDKLILPNGSDLTVASSYSGFEILELSSNASVTLTEAQHDAFTNIIAGGTEQITIADAVDGLVGNANIETYVLNAANTITLDNVGQHVIGSSGDDTLIGGTGEDTIAPGAGTDIITGGTGKDTFSGTAAALNGDTITDLLQDDVLVIQGNTTIDTNGTVEFLDASTLAIDTDGNTATYEIQLTLSNAIGNSLQVVSIIDNGSDTRITFQNETVAPTLSSASPTDNGTTIALNSNIILTFSENIFFGSGTITLFDVTNNSVFETFTPSNTTSGTGSAAGSISISNNAITINPGTDFVTGTEYAVQITTTAVEDIVGNSYAGINDNTTYNFTTVPEITILVNPATIAENGGMATFAVSLVDGNGAPYTAIENIGITVNLSTDSATLNTDYSLADFNGTSNTMTIPAGNSSTTFSVTGVSDMVSDPNETLTATLASFTSTGTAIVSNTNSATVTIVEDNIPPVFTTSTTQSVTENTTAVVTLAATDTNPVTYSIIGGDDDGQFNLTGAALSFSVAPDFESPADLNTDNDYIVQVQASDGANTTNLMITVTVTDIDDTPPTISSTLPADNAADVGLTSDITLTFNENIAFGTGNIQIIDLTDGSNSATIDVTAPGTQATINGTILTLNPSTALEVNSQYAIQIAATAIDDTSGNSFAGIMNNTTFNFSTLNLHAVSVVVDENVSCHGDADGAASVTVTGGAAPYSYIWSTGATTASVANLNAGTYSITVTDANNLMVEESVTITEPAPLNPPTALTIDNIGITSVAFSWTAPATGTVASFDWVVVEAGNDPNTQAVLGGNTTGTSVSNPGMLVKNTAYEVVVRSVCSATSKSAFNTSSTFLTLPDNDDDGITDDTDTDDDNDGTPDTEDAFPLDATEDTDTDGDGIGNNADPDDDNDGILDSNDSEPLVPNATVTIADAMTPNGDGINDNWIIEGIENHPNNTVKVYNRSGREVFSENGYRNTWNGSYNGSGMLPAGSYYYSIDLGNGSTPTTGWIFINY